MASRQRQFESATCIALALGLALMETTVADDARVLPQGRVQAYWDYYRYHDTTHRYNADGKREALAYPFTDAALDSDVLPVLAPLDPFVGKASLGDVSVAYRYEIEVLDLGLNYGVSDDLSIGIHAPYYRIANQVDSSLDSSSANVGINPLTGECCVPLGPGVEPLDIDDVQNLVGSEYGFSEIDDWSGEGIGDIEFGARYRFPRQRSSALATTIGWRVPTGYADDADKLDDVAWSYGTHALLLRLHYDYLLSNLWSGRGRDVHALVPAAGDLSLNLTLRYDYMLPDRKLMRIGDSPDQVLTANRETVERELGDLYNLELSARYHASDALAFTLTYTYAGKFEDRIDGDRGFNYSSLEADTDSRQQIVIVGASYSTLAAYSQRQSGVPMEFSLAYRERFDGEGPSSGQANPVLYTRWLVAGMKFLF